MASEKSSPKELLKSVYSRTFQIQVTEAKLQLAERNVFKHNTHTPKTKKQEIAYERAGKAGDGAGPRTGETILLTFPQYLLHPAHPFTFPLIQNKFLK